MISKTDHGPVVNHVQSHTKVIVITGASGFVGANLVRTCLKAGYDVHLILRPDYQPWRLVQILPRVRVHTHDLVDLPSLKKILLNIKPDWIFHLAANGAYSWQNDLDTIMTTNFYGTVNLVKAAIASGVKVLVNTGSSSEYGYKDHAPLESEIVAPNSYYAISKVAATHYCQFTATQTQSIYIPTLRLYNVYGPYEESKRLMPNLISHALKGELPPLASPDIARDYVYVDDICEAYLKTAKRFSKVINNSKNDDKAPIYNLGTGVQTTLEQVIELIGSLIPLYHDPVWGSMPGRSWDTTLWYSNPQKAKVELGWEAKISLKQGLKKMITWQNSMANLRQSI